MDQDTKMTVVSANMIINNTANEVRSRIDAIIKASRSKDLSVTFNELNAIKDRLDQTKRALLFLRNHVQQSTADDLPQGAV